MAFQCGRVGGLRRGSREGTGSVRRTWQTPAKVLPSADVLGHDDGALFRGLINLWSHDTLARMCPQPYRHEQIVQTQERLSTRQNALKLYPQSSSFGRVFWCACSHAKLRSRTTRWQDCISNHIGMMNRLFKHKNISRRIQHHLRPLL